MDRERLVLLLQILSGTVDVFASIDAWTEAFGEPRPKREEGESVWSMRSRLGYLAKDKAAELIAQEILKE